jgi:hypothetical protein
MVLGGCCTTFRVVYATEIDGADSLRFEDAEFAFSFLPVYNGVVFEIYNKTDTPAYLNWDKTYFVQPDGNSFKAVNADILITADKLADKEAYESVVPPRARFARFTTSAPNVSFLSATSVAEITNATRSGDTIRVVATGSSTTWEAFRAGAFWPIGLTRMNLGLTDEWLSAKGDELALYVRQNDRMGIGFYMIHGETPKEYRFDFRFSRVQVFGEEIDPSTWKRVSRLMYIGTSEADWACAGSGKDGGNDSGNSGVSHKEGRI